jgi:hypothetical protein
MLMRSNAGRAGGSRIVLVDAATIRHAGDLAGNIGCELATLCTLTTADLLQAAIRSEVAFACFDDTLTGAAARLGLRLITDD